MCERYRRCYVRMKTGAQGTSTSRERVTVLPLLIKSEGPNEALGGDEAWPRGR